jgi:hypothetical protein
MHDWLLLQVSTPVEERADFNHSVHGLYATTGTLSSSSLLVTLVYQADILGRRVWTSEFNQ